VVALRDARLALMDRSTFLWLFENSVGFNRFLVGQLNERFGQFIGCSNTLTRQGSLL
jgi:CRP/FNR family transcriptional regulator, cyclic AMP receptor protein